MISAGETSDEVEQVALPEALTGCVPQPVIVIPPEVKFTVPPGLTGVRIAPANCAVNTTVLPTEIAPLGDGVTPRVGLSFETTWLIGVAVAAR